MGRFDISHCKAMNQPQALLSPPDCDYLDCSHEQTRVRTTIDQRRAWLGRDIQPQDWLLRFDAKVLAELECAANFIERHPLQPLQRRLDDLQLPLTRTLFAQLKSILDHGCGFAVADRLPIDDYPLEVLVDLYWVLGQTVAQPVAQKRNGQMIYDVRDTQKAYRYGVRGSWTNVELNFHTDNAFGKCPPDYVGLLCRHPAAAGGISRFCSLYALHQRLAQRHPAALQRLYQPMLYDRQKEHLDNEAPVTLAPFFSWRNDRLRARANPSLVRKGYEVANIAMDSALEEALAIVDDVSSAAEFWYEAALEKGQIQYLNNCEVGHYRSEFSDHKEAARKRHLFRLWHRNDGAPSYDGDDCAD